MVLRWVSAWSGVGRTAPRVPPNALPGALLALCRHLPRGKTSTRAGSACSRTVVGEGGCGGRSAPRLTRRAPGRRLEGGPPQLVGDLLEQCTSSTPPRRRPSPGQAGRGRTTDGDRRPPQGGWRPGGQKLCLCMVVVGDVTFTAAARKAYRGCVHPARRQNGARSTEPSTQAHRRTRFNSWPRRVDLGALGMPERTRGPVVTARRRP